MAGVWYREGTVTLTTGSVAVSGAGTRWASTTPAVRSGALFIGPDGLAYEIDHVLSDTEITLVTPYAGSTAAGQGYSVVRLAQSIAQFSEQLSQFIAKNAAFYEQVHALLSASEPVTLINPDTGASVSAPSWKGLTDLLASKLSLSGGVLSGPLTATSATFNAGLTVNTTADAIVLNASAASANLLLGNNDGVNSWYLGRPAGNNENVVLHSNSHNTNVQLLADSVGVSKSLTPLSDNALSNGTPSARWSTVYAGTGTINTSDAREKTAVTPLSAAEVAAAIDICNDIGTYQWLESIEKKTEDGARHHVGLTVQRAMEIMQEHGLEPLRYGFICYDEWGEEWQEVDDPAGDLIRVEQRPVVSIEPRETSEVTIIDGIPVLMRTVTNVAVPIVNHVPLVDPSGELVLNDQGDPTTYPVPVMESVEVRYRRHLVRPAGNRYSFRMDQLAMFCLRGLLTHQAGLTN